MYWKEESLDHIESLYFDVVHFFPTSEEQSTKKVAGKSIKIYFDFQEKRKEPTSVQDGNPQDEKHNSQ